MTQTQTPLDSINAKASEKIGAEAVADPNETLQSKIKDALQRTEAATFGMNTESSRLNVRTIKHEKADQKRTTLV